jgi:hypothetical protein
LSGRDLSRVRTSETLVLRSESDIFSTLQSRGRVKQRVCIGKMVFVALESTSVTLPPALESDEKVLLLPRPRLCGGEGGVRG